MAEEPIAFHRAHLSFSEGARQPDEKLVTRFDRTELNRILTIYGRMVAAGEWRDYALDFLEDAAVFSIFRRSSEMALFRVEKQPRLRGKQGQYAVIAAGGLVLKRGHELERLYRDARSGLFQPLTTDACHEHLGKFDLGLIQMPGAEPDAETVSEPEAVGVS